MGDDRAAGEDDERPRPLRAITLPPRTNSMKEVGRSLGGPVIEDVALLVMSRG